MTETQKHPIILKEMDAPARQLVQLSADYDLDWSGSSTMVLTASLKEGAVRLRRMSSDEEQRDFSMDDEEMDALCSSWTSFKEKQIAKARAEDERRAQALEQAHEIIRQCPAIRVETYEDVPNCWRVSCPDSGWMTSYPAQDPDSFLRDVKNARADYQRLLPMIEARKQEKNGAA